MNEPKQIVTVKEEQKYINISIDVKKDSPSRAEIISVVVALLAFLFSIYTWNHQIHSETTDTIKIFYGTLYDYSIEYEPMANNNSRTSIGYINLSYPLIIANMSSHKVSLIDSQVTALIDGSEILYYDPVSIYDANDELLEFPLNIDTNETKSIRISIKKRLPGISYAEYIKKIDGETIHYSDLINYYEGQNSPLQKYRITFSTARGLKESFDLEIKPEMIIS